MLTSRKASMPSMTHIIAAGRPRGILNVGGAVVDDDNSAMLAELVQGVQDFKAHERSRVDNLEKQMAAIGNAVDAVTNRQAGMIVAGGGRTLVEDRHSKDLQVLASYVRSGQENLTNFVQTRPRADMNEANNPSGGYTSLPEVDHTIQTIARDASVIRGRSTVVTISSSQYDVIVSYGLPAAGWVGERDQRTILDGVTFKKVSIPVNEMYAMPAVSQSLIDDAFVDLGVHVSGQIATSFAIKEDVAFVGGDGVLAPMGFASYPQSTDDDFDSTGAPIRAFGSVQFVAAGAANPSSDQWVDALVSTSFKLRAPYRNERTCWLMNRNTAAVIRGIKDGSGRLLWDADSGRIANGAPPQLLGFDVVISESMPDIAASSTPILLSDMAQFYCVVDRIGIRMLRDAVTNKPFILFYTTKRVGGGVLDFNAGKLIKCSGS